MGDLLVEIWRAHLCRAQAVFWHALNGTRQSTAEYAVPSQTTTAPGNTLNESWPPLTFMWLWTSSLQAHSLRFLTCLLNSCEVAGFKYIICTQDLECKNFMAVKAILSPQFPLLFLYCYIHPLFGQCGQLPFLNILFSPSFLRARHREEELS